MKAQKLQTQASAAMLKHSQEHLSSHFHHDSGPLQIPDLEWWHFSPSKQPNHIEQELEENEQLARFLEAYESVTGERLMNLDREKKERPDFLCARPGGESVGIELTEVPHKGLFQWDRVFNPDMVVENWELVYSMGEAVVRKEARRAQGDWRPEGGMMLVLTLEDYRFGSFAWLSDDDLPRHFECTEFTEIWACDNTTLGAHGASRLIGLFPQDVRGLHCPPGFDPKPFG